MTERSRIGGIHAMLYALFGRDETVDLGAMRAQARLMLELGLEGIAVLGLATEVAKLSDGERRDIVAAIGNEVAGRGLSYAVTVAGPSVAEQRDMVAHALASGADWIILQPPAVGTYSGDTYLDFFLQVAHGFDCRFAIQNAPQYLGRALSRDDILRLRRANDFFDIVKAEAPAVEVAGLVAAAGPGLSVLNGRGGLEMTDCLRAGVSGFLLAPDTIDHAAKVYRHFQAGRFDEADTAYAAALPAITFEMQSIEHLICYGKRIFGLRAGFEIHDRAPALAPTEFGLTVARRWAERLGPIGADR